MRGSMYSVCTMLYLPLFVCARCRVEEEEGASERRVKMSCACEMEMMRCLLVRERERMEEREKSWAREKEGIWGGAG